MGLHGWADVVAIESCPAIQSGPGRVVLATVTHFNSFVMEVRLAGVAEVLQPTDRHRLFSVTRNDWVPAAQLTVGEELATKTGIVRVEAITAKTGTHRVYNIEVETEHCFYAGAALVLSHNSNPCAIPTRGLWQVTKEGTDKVVSWGSRKIYRHESTGLWWSKDTAGHGGSAWKVFREESGGLKWFKDADQFGDFITGKHKGPVGEFIPWKELTGSKF
jgi:hypothetical protein